MPTAKMQATGLSAAISVLLLWMYTLIPAAPPMPEYVAGAFTALIAWLAGWLTSEVGVKTVSEVAERLGKLEEGMAGIVRVLEGRGANDPGPASGEQRKEAA